MQTSKTIVEDYLNNVDWRVAENSNAPKSIGALQKYMAGEVSKDYWLREIYNKENPDISKAYLDGFIHIHDLGAGLTLYCCGYSLKDIMMKGVKGVSNIPSSYPAKHFFSILNQLVNLTGVYQNEIAGAVAFSSVDTLLAPFIKKDNLSQEEVKQFVQNFIFSINSNSRAGAEPAFSNITLDLTVPSDLLDEPTIIAGEPQDFTYRECQHEMDMFNKAFFEIMLSGDSAGKPFSYPIPTYNIHERFDWSNPNNDLLWEMAGKYGIPYFANFINSDMKIDDARSMCCRLRLDLRELRRKNGGFFGAGDATGSIGVVTINLPRIAYIANHKDQSMEVRESHFFDLLGNYMDIAKESLIVKRKYLQKNILDAHMVPAFEYYVGTFDNHFNTIGLVGMNEMCVNFFGDESKDILSEEGKKFSLDVLDFMRERLSDYQEETNQLWNLEATPAESTSYRLAQKDKDEFGEYIFTQGPADAPYYTNSCHIPVNKLTTIESLFDHQDELQCKFTGGTVVHIWLEGPISGVQAKTIIQSVCTKYKLPYVSLSPLNTICPEHGLLNRSYDNCPLCGRVVTKLQRITGYVRKISDENGIYWNKGKYSEFLDRKQIKA